MIKMASNTRTLLIVLFSLYTMCRCQNSREYISTFKYDNIEIMCDISDSANRNIIWKFVDNDVWLAKGEVVYENIGSMFSRVSVVVDSSSSRLRISDIHTSDTGRYQCGFETDQREFEMIFETRVVVVDADTTPSCLMSMLPNIGTVQGTEVDIKCAWPSSLPMGHAIIHKNGIEMNPDVTMDDHVVLRTILNEGDLFTCQLVSPLATEKRACTVIPLTASGLKVRTDPLVAYVEVGGDAQFNCTAEANEPIESYLWSLKADAVLRFLSKPDRFRTDDNSRRLSLFNLEIIDDRLWVKCSAEAQDGTSVLSMSAVKIIVTPPSHQSTTAMTPNQSAIIPIRRTTLKLTEGTTTYATPELTSNSTDVATPGSRTSLPLSAPFIALIALGGLIVFLVMIVIIVVSIKISRQRSASKDVDRHNVNTRWVMSTPEITMSEDVSERPTKSRFGRKSRSSSRKFLYSRRSSKKKNRSNSSSAQKPTGVVRHLPPQPVTPDPRAIYQNIPRSGSSNSLHSLHSVQQKIRGESSHSYEVVKPEPPDVIAYKKPRPKQLVYPMVGGEVGYASVENPEEVPSLIYAELDVTANIQIAPPVGKDFDPSILYAKVKK
ncbi:uncharacterized protein LOC135157725 [Lytechinus pictus]|uniref:uncharacterized protein LOC135157725 n=1 Tax=Lytechinus pictus TaxID=7653 RepID=UPI0030B9D5BB